MSILSKDFKKGYRVIHKKEHRQLKRENQEIRELVNKLVKNKDEIVSEMPDYYDGRSFGRGFDYVLDEIKTILNK